MAPSQKRTRLSTTASTSSNEDQHPPPDRAGESSAALDAAKRSVACAAAREEAARAALDSCEKALAALQEARERALSELEVASQGKRDADAILEKVETERKVIDVDLEDLPSCSLLKTFCHNGDDGDCVEVCFLGDNSFVSCGTSSLKLWDLSSGLCTQSFQYCENEDSSYYDIPHTVAPMYNSNILTGSDQGWIILWDAVTGKQVRKFEGHTSAVFSIAALDRNTFISGSHDKTTKVWNASTGECIRTMKGQDRVSCIASLGRYRVLAGEAGGTIQLWGFVSDGICIRTYKAHEQAVDDIITLDDDDDDEERILSKKFLSASYDRTIKLWQASHDECLRTFVGHSGRVVSVAVIDANRFVSGSSDGTIKLWNLAQGTCMYTYQYTKPSCPNTFQAKPSPGGLCVVGGNRILSGDTCGEVKLLEYS